MRDSNAALMPLSPLKGIVLFNSSSNRAVHSIPANVGKKAATRTIDEAELEYINSRFFWPNKKTSKEIPQKLRTEYKSEEEFLGLNFIQNVESRALLKPLITYFAE